MACTETLVHAADIAEGLGLDFAPPPEIPEKALARLFPWVQNEGDPWQALPLRRRSHAPRREGAASAQLVVALRPAQRVGRHGEGPACLETLHAQQDNA